MSGWTAKRFWTEASARPCEGGWGVWLDERQVRTPAKAPLVVPTQPLALAIAQEWQAQESAVDPMSMPLTRAANAAVDKVSAQFEEVAELIAAYGASDLLCYRAEGPEGLVARQSAGWDPLLDWARSELGAPLSTGPGVVPLEQPGQSIGALAREVRRLSPFELTALHEFVGISGSLVLGLAIHHGRLTAEEALTLSRIDECWQAELWGEDEEAAAVATKKAADFMSAHNFLKLIAVDT
ncbi:ATP12 family chaperone protein [Albidovulum sediminicola]|uniref:ATPase n=1 Tax=Albidovulum sediminicola TaxID=2984331 RepID=A0ABT2Z499_9RHOB|nr:ATP12 family protein [Defluviimonas sp. WL0075]MCV2865953.1 ATPase [Defluviimonas sp. WL0075]